MRKVNNRITGINSQKMIALHPDKDFTITNEKTQPARRPKANFDTDKAIISKLKNIGEFTAKKVSPYLTLSAKTPYIESKGFINAINCQASFPDEPNISFPWWTPQQQSLPTAGKLEIWLTDLESSQNLTVEIRTTGYSASSSSVFEIRSSMSPGLYGYFPIKVNSKIDLFFPDIETQGMELITIEANNMEGSWVFFDARINIID
ncbi:MAG: hypothetical protein ABI792_02050 [bacterium]